MQKSLRDSVNPKCLLLLPLLLMLPVTGKLEFNLNNLLLIFSAQYALS